MQSLRIIDTHVRQDKDGRYSLNDCHRAAMAAGRASPNQRPSNFMRRKETAGLIAAVQRRCSDLSIAPVSVVKGGSAGITQGTFVSKPLVYAYAMWINPDFHLDVIEAFDSLMVGDQGLWQQMQALIAREVESKVRASFGSHLMLKRKREIPEFNEQRAVLEAAIQPSLLN